MNNPDDSDLPAIEALREGSAQAWDAFFSHFNRLIHAIVAWPKWHFDYHTQQDVAQTIKLEIVQSLDRLHAEHSMNAFIRKICVNRSIDTLRKLIRAQNRFVPMSRLSEDGDWEETDFADDSAFDPVAILQQNERIHLVQTLLSQIDPSCEALIREFYMEGLSYREIAQRHNIPVNTVGSRLSRSLAKLRNLLPQKDKDMESLNLIPRSSSRTSNKDNVSP